jgi:nucleoid DNA-binding protein
MATKSMTKTQLVDALVKKSGNRFGTPTAPRAGDADARGIAEPWRVVKMATKSMTKTQLVDALVKETEMTKKDVKVFLAGLTNMVEKSLKRDVAVPLSGLGKFKVQSRKARIGRNPQTGAAITAHYFTAKLPVGVGDVRYYIEAEDGKGNVSRGALERVYLA